MSSLPELLPYSINLEDRLTLVNEHWMPKIVADYNGNDIMVVKIQGEFQWHSHPETDDLFLVLQGTLRIELRHASGEESHVTLRPGELFVVPRGVEHRPVAEEEVHMLLIEPAGTPNTGDPNTAVYKERI